MAADPGGPLSSHHGAMLRSWLSWSLLPTALPALAEPTGELAEKLREAVHAHDPAAQVAAPERSPVRGL